MTKRKSKRAEWEANAEEVRKRLESAWSQSEREMRTLWHRSAIATLHWVSSHRGRVAAFRKSVKGTPVERVMDAALKALREEGRTPARRKRAVHRRAA